MYRSVNRLHRLPQKSVFEKAWFSVWARTRSGNLAATEKNHEPRGPAVDVPCSKWKQNLSGGIAVSRASEWLHTSCQSLLADKINSSAEGSNTEKAPGANEYNVESDTGAKSSLSTIQAKNPVSWLSFCLTLITGAGLIYFYYLEKKRHIKARQGAVTELKPESSGAGKSAIGGPFKLINHEGKEVTSEQFKGDWTLLYFGFTHCPDICPDELQKMVEAIDIIEKKNNLRITPVFISIDPERDTVEQMQEYVKEFHPRLIGLTGSLDEIKQVARAYRVYYMKTGEENSDYLIDHSIIMYLMDPEMEFVKFFGKNYDVNSLADGIMAEIKGYKS